MIFDTKLLKLNEKSISLAAALLQQGEVVAFPTETVYGLGANALNEEAVKKIFIAKGRPNDNPLIVHTADIEGLKRLVLYFPKEAELLAEKFMPGPLTLVLPKNPCIPDIVTGGLNTVAVRIPALKGARELIAKANCPLAAPSANISGSPSPTRAAHVFDDLKGRIPLILDGGACTVGVESTVLSLIGEKPMLLRPGLISPEQIEAVIGKIEIHTSVLKNSQIDAAASPGMKYKHYSPHAKVIIVNGQATAAIRLFDIAKNVGLKPALLWNKEELPCFGERAAYALLEYNDLSIAAERLFDLLRSLDDAKMDLIIVQALPLKGAGLSVMNRLLRAAAFNMLENEFLLNASIKEILSIMSNNGIIEDKG